MVETDVDRDADTDVDLDAETEEEVVGETDRDVVVVSDRETDTDVVLEVVVVGDTVVRSMWKPQKYGRLPPF